MANNSKTNNNKNFSKKRRSNNNVRDNAPAKTGTNGGSNPNKYSSNGNGSDELKQIVGSLQFPPYIGVPLDAFSSAIEHPKHGIPTVCEIPFMTTYGQANGVPTDSLNTAAIHLHSMIMSKLNRATKAYDANDLMCACICCDSIVTVYNYFRTMVSQVMTYSNSNRALPRVIVEAMGFDFDDIRINLNDLKMYLEMFAAKLNSLQIPKVMDVSDDHLYLTGNIFCDNDSVYPQVYVFHLANYYYFDQTTEPGKTLATCKNLGTIPGAGTDKWKTENIYTVMDTMYNSLFTSYDFGNILADLRTAIPDVEIILSNPSFDAIEPIYDKDILMALHNSTPSALVDAVSLTVKSAIDSNYAAVLTINPEIYVKSYGYNQDMIVDVTPEYQNAEGIYSVSRWMVTLPFEEQVEQGSNVIQGKSHLDPVSVYVKVQNPAVGTEVLFTPIIHFPAYDKTSNEVVDVSFNMRDFGGDVLEGMDYGASTIYNAYEAAALYTMFDYLPMNPCIHYSLTSGMYHFDATPQTIVGMTDAVTTMTSDQIGKIHAYRIMDKLLKFTK